MKPVVVPRPPRPEVSVLVPTYGHENVVLEALATLVRHTPPVYEVVVVDNASPDGLGERLAAQVPGARVVRNAENLGFGAACNQAADLSVAPVLVFLNSDAFVHPGWLPPLLRGLERERTGAAAPRVLNADGTLQEAGCLVFANAHTRFSGFGDDPALTGHLFPRRVDYSSAVCLAVKRRAFHDAGGFDPAFGLGYCEDVDLCLRLRANGLDTVYEPESVVTHLRGTSSDPGVALALWTRNVELLRDRWKVHLAARPSAPGPEPEPPWRKVVARDAAAALRVLVVEARAEAFREGPTVPDRTLWLTTHLASRWPGVQTTLLTGRRGPEAAPLETLRRAGVEVVEEGRDPEAWLAGRRFHDDVVILRTAAAHRLAAAALERHQPQAQLVLDTVAPPPSGGSPLLPSRGAERGVDAVFASDRRSWRMLRALAPSPLSLLVPTGQAGALDSALASVGVPPDSP